MFIGPFLSFVLFFFTSMAVITIFLYLYAIVTPYDDYTLIFKENNTAAAVTFGGAILGVSVPLYSALMSSVSYFDFLFWSVLAMFVQLLFAFVLTRIGSKLSFEKQIKEGVLSVGILMAFLSIAIGILSAGSMSY